jgi:site-specific recombinase XerD
MHAIGDRILTIFRLDLTMPPRVQPQPVPLANLEAGQNGIDWLAFERSRRALNRSPKTIDSYRQSVADLANFRPGINLADMTRNDLEEYFVARLARLASSTVAIRFRSLKVFFNWAVREEIITRSPMVGMAQPKVTDSPPPILDDGQLKLLLAACDGKEFADRRDAAIIRVFCEPGSPRVAEMAGLMLVDLDMRGDLITLRGKGDKVRQVPFGAKTGQALDRYLRMRSRHALASSPMLWLGAKKTTLTASGVTKMLRRRSAMAGIGHVHPHQLRHTAAHVWMDSDGSESNAMQLFGWSSPEMPRRYGRSAAVARAQRSARRKSLGDRL